MVPDELADLEQLLWRLAQGGGVMGASPPVPQYRSLLSRDFHSVFIAFCQDRELQYLLYAYLEHHRWPLAASARPARLAANVCRLAG